MKGRYLVQGGIVSALFVDGSIVREGEWFIPKTAAFVPAMRLSEAIDTMAEKFPMVRAIPVSSTRRASLPQRISE